MKIPIKVKNIKLIKSTPPKGKKTEKPISIIASDGEYHGSPVNKKLLKYSKNVAKLGKNIVIQKVKCFSFNLNRFDTSHNNPKKNAVKNIIPLIIINIIILSILSKPTIIENIQ